MARSIVHSAHSAHAAAARHGWALLLRQFGYHRFGSDQEARNRGSILQRDAQNLGRVDDALGHQIAELAGLRVVAVSVGIVLQDLADHDRAILAGVHCDLARRPGDRLFDDLDAVPLVLVFALKLLDRLPGAQQRDPAAGQDAFLDCGAGRMHSIVDAVLALLYLGLGGAADTDYCNAAGEFGQPLLQFLLVVVGGGLLDLRLDLIDARLDVGLLAGAVDDRGVLLVDQHLLGLAKHGERHFLELDAEVFRDRLAAGQDGDVLQHGLAAIAEARRLDRRDLEAAAQLVDDERGQRLELDPHLVGVGDEVGRDVAAVELHALDHVKLGLEALRLFHRDDALVADLL